MRLLSFFNLLLAGFFIFSFLGSNQAAAAQYDYDLGIRAEDLSFTATRMIVEQKVRVYAMVYNYGNQDTSGFVSFYQGAQLLGDSQAMSVRAHGFADEVFIDFIVPQGPFNILAAIRGTNPPDQNPANNEALTTIFTPVVDADNDGMPDEQDNCPTAANANQQDSDGDKIGDACDPDNDNDGLSDINETRMGTSGFNPDTDGDGITDNKDKNPLVSDKSLPASVITTPKIAAAPSKDKQVAIAEQEPAPEPEPEKVSPDTGKKISSLPLKIISADFEKRDWGNYAFFAQAVGGAGNYTWNWDFGDGQGALGQNIIHRFRKTGDYRVRVSVKDKNNKTEQTEFSVSVSFYNAANPKVWLAVGFLVATAGTLLFVSRRKKDKFFIS